mgnify:FL=1
MGGGIQKPAIYFPEKHTFISKAAAEEFEYEFLLADPKNITPAKLTNKLQNYLCKHQFSSRAKTHFGETFLHLICKASNTSQYDNCINFLKLILPFYKNHNTILNSVCFQRSTALHRAIINGNFDAVELLMRWGVDLTLSSKTFESYPWCFGKFFYLYSLSATGPSTEELEQRFIDIFTLFDLYKTDLNVLDSRGLTFVHELLLRKQINRKMLTFLLKSTTFGVQKGKNLLHFSVEVMNLDCVELLLQSKQIDPSSLYTERDGLLHTVCRSATSAEEVKQLVGLLEKYMELKEFKKLLNKQNIRGMTPLHCLAENALASSIESFELLMSKGSDISILDCNQKYASQLLRKIDREAMLKLIHKYCIQRKLVYIIYDLKQQGRNERENLLKLKIESVVKWLEMEPRHIEEEFFDHLVIYKDIESLVQFEDPRSPLSHSFVDEYEYEGGEEME